MLNVNIDLKVAYLTSLIIGQYIFNVSWTTNQDKASSNRFYLNSTWYIWSEKMRATTRVQYLIREDLLWFNISIHLLTNTGWPKTRLHILNVILHPCEYIDTFWSSNNEPLPHHISCWIKNYRMGLWLTSQRHLFTVKVLNFVANCQCLPFMRIIIFANHTFLIIKVLGLSMFANLASSRNLTLTMRRAWADNRHKMSKNI